MSNNNIGQECFKLYQQAKKNLEADDPNLQDECFVYMWNTSKEALAETTILKKELQDMQKRLAEKDFELSVVETKLAIIEGTYSREISIPAMKMN